MTTGMGPRNLSFSWQQPECGKRHGVIVMYTYELTNGLTNNNINGETTDSSVTISNLTPYVTYTFKVAAVNTAGMGPFGEIVTHTEEDGKYYASKRVCRCLLSKAF